MAEYERQQTELPVEEAVQVEHVRCAAIYFASQPGPRAQRWRDVGHAGLADLVPRAGQYVGVGAGVAQVSIEAASSQSWYDLIGLDGRALSVDTFGASASAGELFEKFGLTSDHAVRAARELLAGN